MSSQNPQRTELKIYTTLEQIFVQLASSRTSSLREHLRNHGIQLLFPQSVTMGTHDMELPANVDLTAVQLLIDQWAKALADAGPGACGSGSNKVLEHHHVRAEVADATNGPNAQRSAGGVAFPERPLKQPGTSGQWALYPVEVL